MTLLLVGAALAATPHSHGHDGLLSSDSLYEATLAHFDSTPVPGEHFSCGTVLVHQVRQSWDSFTPQQRAELTHLITPWKTDLLDELPAGPPAPPATGGVPTDTCFGQFGAYRHETDLFAIEWDGDNIDERDIERFGEALEYSYLRQIEEEGWLAPEGMDTYKLLVYVDDSNYAGAYTTVERCDNQYIPYIVTGNGVFWGDWYQDLATHEFNHASQFSYGYAHEFWWWEATATYIEEQVYPDHDAWAPYITGYADAPYIAMNAYSQSNAEVFYHMYAMAIFGFYLDNHWGGTDIVRELWEVALDHPFMMYELWMPDAVEELGYDWGEVYPGFIAANTVMDYDEGNEMGRIHRMGTSDELPFEGNSERAEEPQSLGQNYWKIAGEAFDPDEPDLHLYFEGADEADWMVLLVGVQGDTVVDIVAAHHLDDPDEGEEALRVTMTDWGQHEDVWVVVSPTIQSWDEYRYAFDAWSEPAPVEEPEEPEEPEEEDAERPILGSCSARPGPATLPAWALAVLGGLLVRRRL